jgi:hypothetical protein
LLRVMTLLFGGGRGGLRGILIGCNMLESCQLAL